MADNLGVQFFTDAKAQFESAGFWRCVIVALLAYLHVGLVAPFVAYTREKAAIDRELKDNRAAEGALKPVVDASGRLVETVNEAKNEVALHLKDELVERFKRLNKAISELAALDPGEAEGEKGAAVFGNSSPQSMMAQQQMTPDPLALVPMSGQLRRRIAESARSFIFDRGPMGFQNYVDSELIKPAFEHAKAEWANTGLKFAQDGAAAIANGIAHAKAVAPAAAELDQLGESVEAFRNEAQRLDFAAPDNPRWWATVGGKQQSISGMTSGLAAQATIFFTNQMALQKQLTQIADLVGKNQQAAADLNETLDDLDKRAAALQSQLGEIGAPLGVISFKLSEIAPIMPLIVAATLAALSAWSALGLKRMTLAAGLVSDQSDGATIRTWLHAAAGGSRGRVTALELAVTIACLVWVLIAAWNVAPLPPPFLTLPILTAIAAAVVVVARVYHWRCAVEAESAGSATENRHRLRRAGASRG